MQRGVAQFDDLMSEFARVFEIPIDPVNRERSASLMACYHLSSYDALHVATALELGIIDFATLDADFTAVAELDVVLLQGS